MILGKELDFSAGISIGLVRGLTVAVSLVGVGSIVFSGDLAPFAMGGIGMFLIGTAILSLWLAFFGNFPSPVATTPLPTALMMIAIAHSLDLQGRELYVAFVISILGCTLVTGVFFLAIGYFKVANILRYVPFTVSAGALAASGILIMIFSLRISGMNWDIEDPLSLLKTSNLWHPLLSVALGVTFVIASKIWRRVWLIPLLLLLYSIAFYLVLLTLEIPIEDAVGMGLYLDMDSSAKLWPPLEWSDFSTVDWTLIAFQATSASALFLVLLTLTILSFAQLELGARKDFDWNREFVHHGFANLLSTVGGGVPGANVAHVALPNIALRANTPITSIVISAVLIVVLILGTGIVRLVPVSAIGAFLIVISVPLVSDWLLKPRKRLGVPEYSMLLVICATILIFGFLQGIVLGMVLSLVLFAVRLSQANSVESHYTVSDRTSHKIRSIPESMILKVYGSRARFYRVQGYIFFGVAYSLTRRLQESLDADPSPTCVGIDFAGVTGFDLSALDGLISFVQRANQQNISVVVSSASEKMSAEIKSNLPTTLEDAVTWVDSEAEALVEAEEMLLSHFEQDVATDPSIRNLVRLSTNSELTEYLNRQALFEELISDLRDRFQIIEYEDLASITIPDTSSKGMQLLVSGRVSVRTDNGSILYQCDPGTVIESASAVENAKSVVSVTADGPCQTMIIEPDGLQRLEREDNAMALRLYKYLVSEKTIGVRL